ncbi:MAG: FCD domain-containing protein [Solirubrobacterales bacterium]
MGTDLDDLIDFRGAVEPAGAALAAARRGNDDIQLLRELLDASRDAASADSAAFRGPDARLHLAICDAASSSLILEAAIEIQVRLNEVLAITPILDQAILHSHQQHAEIIAAIEAGDAASARSRMEEHLEGTRELILTLTQPARE